MHVHIDFVLDVRCMHPVVGTLLNLVSMLFSAT